MNQESSNDLANMPRFREGEIVSVNGISFRVYRISGIHLTLACVDSEAQRWQAFGQGIVQQLSENGLLSPKSE